MYEFGRAEIGAAERVLRSRVLFRYLPDAHEVDGFERSLARHMGALHALATSSGTASLICGLSALGIGPGDEVVVPAYGFVAVVNAPLAVGAVPVVCDIDESLTMDPVDLQRKITARTRAVLPVHVHGWAADLDTICRIADENGLAVLEDACQAIGGTYHGARLGTIGDAGAFSFNQHKIITAGEGGALVTNRTRVYERAFVTHDGSCAFSQHTFENPDFAGLAFRMSEVSAAILSVQLARLDGIIDRLREVHDRVDSVLSGAGLCRVRPHDPAGSCGTHIGCLFKDAEEAARFAAAVDSSDVDAFQGVGYGHSFPEWDLLHRRRGGHHPLRNPLLSTDWQQGADACAASLDILRRCVLVRYPLGLTDASIDDLRRRVTGVVGSRSGGGAF